MFSVTQSAARCMFSRCSTYRCFSTSLHLSGPTVAVVLSGSGVYDGSEIHEASATLVSLTRAGAEPVCYAPDVDQMHVINHIKGEPMAGEKRNVLVESARIARGNVKPLSELSAKSADAVVFPGGFGAAKNLSDFAVNGPNCTVNPDVTRVLKDFHSSKKPIALCCIAPTVCAKVLGNIKLTVGKPDDGSGKWPFGGAVDALKAMGATAAELDVGEVCLDEQNKVVTTPAFMYNGKFHEVHDGIAKMIKTMLTLIK